MTPLNAYVHEDDLRFQSLCRVYVSYIYCTGLRPTKLSTASSRSAIRALAELVFVTGQT